MVSRLKKVRLGTRRRSTSSYRPVVRPTRTDEAMSSRSNRVSYWRRTTRSSASFRPSMSRHCRTKTVTTRIGLRSRIPDVAAKDLGNWYLTDDGGDLRKWRFPAGTIIEPGEQLVVFASNKDRTDGPQNQLHTNFQLSGDGEYLALVTPAGLVSQEYAPAYPPQIADQSYGIGVGRDIYELVSPDGAATAHVPTDDSLDMTWTEPGFDDAAWMSGTSGVGFEVWRRHMSSTSLLTIRWVRHGRSTFLPRGWGRSA